MALRKKYSRKANILGYELPKGGGGGWAWKVLKGWQI